MKPKLLKYGTEARASIKKGLDTLANAVKATLGPRGRNVIYSSGYMPPLITKDGVTVARQIDMEDPFEQQGCELGKMAAGKTVETAGDGTTTAVVLTQALYGEGIKILSSGVNPILLKKGIDLAVSEVVSNLKNMAKKVTGDSDAIKDVAMIASNNDNAIATLIVDAIKKVGEDGVITIEDSANSDSYMETTEGMQLSEGLVNPWFINQGNRLLSIQKKPKILVAMKTIRDPAEISPIFEKCIEAGRPFVLIAEGVEGPALATMIRTFREGGHACMAVKAPGYGDRRRDFMEDIAIYTGTRVYAEEAGDDLRKLELADLGSCDSMEAGKEAAVIVNGAGKKDNINARIEEIKDEISATESDYEKEKLQERLAKLTSGVAVLKVGAPTQAEAVEKKFRVEDSLHATRCAIEEGIVPGGGVSLLRCGDKTLPTGDLTEEEMIGYALLKKILRVPLDTLVSNAGWEGAEVIAKIRASKKANYGLDVLKNVYGDMLEMGVIDPVKVVRLALENAASTAGLALTTEVIIADKPQEEKKPYGPERDK